MKARTHVIAWIIYLICAALMIQNAHAESYQGENITYDIKPLGGKAEYSDLGLTDLDGRKVKLTMFKTNILGFKDTEKIYSDPQTSLPIRVERDIKHWFGRENIIEKYDQEDFKVTITKFKGKRKMSEQVFLSDGPIHNAVLVPFYLRQMSDMKVGWSFVFRLPNKFEANLASIEEVRVGEKTSSTCHFTGVPDKFEIWISHDDLRIPVKIKGKGSFNYTLLIKERNMPLDH